jgi:hypothetical protein
MANAIDQQLQSCFLELNENEKKSVLLLLKTFLGNRKGVAERVSLAQYNAELDEALAEEAAGDYITQHEMEIEAAKW